MIVRPRAFLPQGHRSYSLAQPHTKINTIGEWKHHTAITTGGETAVEAAYGQAGRTCSKFGGRPASELLSSGVRAQAAFLSD